MVGLFGFVGLLDGGPVRFVGSASVVVDVGPGVVGCAVGSWCPVVDGAVATVVRLDTLLVVEVGGVVAEPTAPPVRQPKLR